jgi:invasion protein IalB
MFRPLAAALLATALTTGAASAASTLPGNATTLTETHDDWTVRCSVDQTVVHCAAQQEQLSNQTKQRVLAIEILPGKDVLTGTLVLPFGLELGKGTVLKVDDTLTSPVLSFKTCLPAGCLVPLQIGAEWEKAMRTGTTLAVIATAVSGQDAKFSISLKGLPSALDRITELTK